MHLNRNVVRATVSPIGAAHDLIVGRAGERPLLDLSQAAPRYPAAPVVCEQVATAAFDPAGGTYTEIAGLPDLREAFAAELSADYRGRIDGANIVVTAGCNQAFCLVMSALAAPGDEVIMVLPYYFNHVMWLTMAGIRPVFLEPGSDLIPSVHATEHLITSRTRAIVLVTPGNPTGVTVPPDRLAAFADLADRHGIALVLDETYRSFRETTAPPHDLFSGPDRLRTVISLHSFSKDLAIPGYRVGAVVGSTDLIHELTELIDCVAVCAPRIGQLAALTGLREAGAWRRERAAEIATQRRLFAAVLADRPGGFQIVSLGAFFGWVRHPFTGRSTAEVVRDLILRLDILVVPGTAFLPEDRAMLRVSVGNADPDELTELAARLAPAAG
ncbi:aminotransferase [Pseudonocardia sp. ICBG1142]|uniref:aminotransferase n=1 Tax=Pseudonocardia sp. ICBG1142 TaxID=2846760 RepID=UPI001CF70626|nr:aminotransferase [Pseudonocardia sp. ICBG1142]